MVGPARRTLNLRPILAERASPPRIAKKVQRREAFAAARPPTSVGCGAGAWEPSPWRAGNETPLPLPRGVKQ